MDEGQPHGEKGSKRKRKAGKDPQATNPASQRNTPFSLVSFLRKRKAEEERRLAIEEEEERRRIRRQIAKKRRAAIIRKLRAAALRRKGNAGKHRDALAAPPPLDEEDDDRLSDDDLEDALDEFTDEELDDDLLDEELDEEELAEEQLDEEEYLEEESDAEFDQPAARSARIPRPPEDTPQPFGADFRGPIPSDDQIVAAENAKKDGPSVTEPFSLAPGETLPQPAPVRPPSPLAIAIGLFVYFVIPAIFAIGLVVWIINRPDSSPPEIRTQAPPPKPKLEDLLSASQAAAQRGDSRRASKLASEALTLHPDDFRSHLNAASLKIKAGKLAEAGPDLKRASELAPKNPDPIAMRAEWAFLSGNFKEARDLHRRLYPYSTLIPPIITLQLYVCEMTLGNTVEANLLLEKNPLPSPGLEWFWLNILQTRHQGNPHESLHLAESTLPLYGDQAKAAMNTFKRLGWPERDLLAPAPNSLPAH